MYAVMELTYNRCISLMPELRGATLDIQELKGGITNKLYRVKSEDGQDYVFRLYGKQTGLFIDRDVEMQNLQRLAPLGVTPKVIRYLPDEGVTVVEFIPGYVLSNQDFLKEHLWDLIISPIRIIHQCELKLPYIFNPLAEVKRFYRILQGINSNYLEFDIPSIIRIFEKIYDIGALPSLKYAPCHNDLLAENFILVEGEERFREPVYLIDWEYGGMAPLYYDIADMFQEILVSREVERNLLMIYWEGRNVDYHEYMTDLFKPFPDIYWFIWSLIQMNISTIEFDYYNYGRVKFENAKKNIDYLRNYYNIRI